jgi:hypothetical protein
MEKKGDIASCSAEELGGMRSGTDWPKADAATRVTVTGRRRRVAPKRRPTPAAVFDGNATISSRVESKRSDAKSISMPIRPFTSKSMLRPPVTSRVSAPGSGELDMEAVGAGIVVRFHG